MLEIILLYMMGKKIAAIARDKGRNGTGYVFMLLAFWFGGEIGGAIIGVLVSLAVNPHQEPQLAIAYGLALVCAVIGMVISFVIVNNLSPLYGPDEGHDDELDIRIRR